MLSKISELAERQIINITDGKCLGSMKDIELDLDEGRIKYIVLPGNSGIWGLLPSRDELLIPWENVVRIGIDVVLVQLPQPETAKPHRSLRPAKQSPEKWQQELAAYQNELESGQTVRISYDKQKIEEPPLVEGARKKHLP